MTPTTTTTSPPASQPAKPPRTLISLFSTLFPISPRARRYTRVVHTLHHRQAACGCSEWPGKVKNTPQNAMRRSTVHPPNNDTAWQMAWWGAEGGSGWFKFLYSGKAALFRPILLHQLASPYQIYLTSALVIWFSSWCTGTGMCG